MRCPSCRDTFDDSLRFCPRDGTRLVADANVPAAAASGGRATGVVIGVLGTVVVVLAVAIAFLMLRDESPEPIASEQALPSQAFGGGGVSPLPDEGSDGLGEGPEIEPVVETALPTPRELVEVEPSAPTKEIRASFGPARVETDGTGLVLRAGPGRQHDVIAKMLPGDVVTVDGCDDGDERWCSVEYGGVRGWTLDTYLDIGGPETDTSSGLEDAFAASQVIDRPAYIDGSEVRFVNLRARPYVGGELLLRMRPGTTIRVLRCLPTGWSLGGRSIEGRWCFVTATRSGRSVSGWASDGALRW